MKEIYITYDRYGRDEWYSVYHLGVNKKKAVQDFLHTSLPSFIRYGPDDCHAFQLQCVYMSDYQYRKLRALVNANDKTAELTAFMTRIYAEAYETETLFFTDGCSDLTEIARLYCESHNMDFNNVADSDAAWQALDNDDVFEEYLQQYIAKEYSEEGQ